ncbi:hypothetical protein [Bifidobacterium avesanii]|nr:hypothetical protein [Bifidobacterium avesanii]KAB8293644.1 hypothetical protein DSM100685_0712 [Bifidobacterium avesanii]
MTNRIKAIDIDRKFDDGEDVMKYFDISNPIVEVAPARRHKVGIGTADSG